MNATTVILTAMDAELAAAWRASTRDLDFVEVHEGSIFDVGADALVSPANSFGFMDGGIDMLYSRRFGWELSARLQEVIRTRHHGELLVGAAAIVPTHATPAYLIAAPTMRVPMILGNETIAPYLAARAVFLLVKHGRFDDGTPVADRVRRVAFPGLGTGIGEFHPRRARTRSAPRSTRSFARRRRSQRPGTKRKPDTSSSTAPTRAISSTSAESRPR